MNRSKRLTTGLMSLLIGLVVLITGCSSNSDIVIGTQSYTETKILAEMYKALIEDQTELSVSIIPDLASSTVVINAMKRDELQLATLYSGEIFNNHFPIQDTKDRNEVLAQAKQGFDQYLGFKWLDSLGFENTYAFTVREDIAAEKGYTDISDVAEDANELRVGVDTTWLERDNDGYPAFQKTYQFKFGKEYPMQQSLVYEAVSNDQVDIVLAYSTDSRLKAYNLKTLKDDKQFFPPYDASPVFRKDITSKYPEAEQAIAPLLGKVNAETMIELNYQVDIEKMSEREVALQYLREQGLIQ